MDLPAGKEPILNEMTQCNTTELNDKTKDNIV